MIDKPTRLVPNKHYKKEVLMMCDKQDIIDYCHEMEQRFFQAMLIIDKLIERKELNEKDIKIIIFSNKPNEILQKLVSNKLSDIKLEFIQGQDKNYPPKPDVTLLRKILNSLNLDPKDGIYVGDSDVDTYTARNIGMPSIILSYGYGDKKLISESKPDYYIDDFSDIIKLI